MMIAGCGPLENSQMVMVNSKLPENLIEHIGLLIYYLVGLYLTVCWYVMDATIHYVAIQHIYLLELALTIMPIEMPKEDKLRGIRMEDTPTQKRQLGAKNTVMLY
jgi:hypothetical protein